MNAPPKIPERLGVVLGSRGLGDCLFAMAVMRKMHASLQGRCAFDVFTHQPDLFRACPWVASWSMSTVARWRTRWLAGRRSESTRSPGVTALPRVISFVRSPVPGPA